MSYNTPITSRQHALFCLDEATRRYCGELVYDQYNMLVVDDGELTHTDAVLRALSNDEDLLAYLKRFDLISRMAI